MEKWRLRRAIHVEVDMTLHLAQQFREFGTRDLMVFPMYDYHLPRIDTGTIRKVLIHLTDLRPPALGHQQLLDVIIIPTYFNAEEFFALAMEVRKPYLLETVHQATSRFAQSSGWDLDGFEAAKQAVLSRNFTFEGTWGKTSTKREKGESVQVKWVYEEKINVYLEFVGAQEETLLVTTLPATMGALEAILGKLSSDGSKVTLSMTNQRDYWTYDLEGHNLQFHYPRAENGDAHGQYDLAIMYLDGRLVPRDREKARYWLEKSATQKFGRAAKLLQKLNEYPPEETKIETSTL